MHVWGDGFQASQLCRYKVVTKKMSENTYGTSNSHFHIFIASANTIQTVRVVEHLRPIKVPVILIKIVTLPALKKWILVYQQHCNMVSLTKVQDSCLSYYCGA